MDERTMEYGGNSREDFYKVLYSILVDAVTDPACLPSVPGLQALSTERKLGIKAALAAFADVIVQIAHMSMLGGDEVNPVHRPVVEELMTDLQAMLDKMPAEEKPKASATTAFQLQRVSDGAIFNVLGTKTRATGGKSTDGDVVWLQRVGSPHGPFGHGNDHLRNDFIAYPPQEPDSPARKTWACPDHGIRPWQSKPGLLRGWCHKELADDTECGQELVEEPKPRDPFRPPGMFHNA